MPRQLLLLRHGKSDWSRGLPDFDRPLKGRGRREAAALGRWLAGRGLQPDLVLASKAARARQTAERVCAAMACPAQRIRFEDGLYLAGVPALLALLRGVPEQCRRVMLVGHNPGLEDLLLALALHPPQTAGQDKLLPTACLALLETEGAWHEAGAGNFRLQLLQRGRGLEESR